MSDSVWTPPASAPAEGATALARFRLRRGVKGLAAADGTALLVRERHADGTPFWTLPGGGVRSGESPRAALERELDEELQCDCVPGDRLTRFHYVHSSLGRTASVYAVYECDLLTRPTPSDRHGVTGLRWVEPGSFPSGTLPQVRTVVSELLD